MRTWKIDIEENRVIIRGTLTMPDLTKVIKNFCKANWIIDAQQAQDIGANFVIREPDYAVNQ